MHRGWVRLWRKKLDSRLAKDVRLWFLFDILVIQARVTPGWVSLPSLTGPVKLERGQLLTGRESLHKTMAAAMPWKKPSSRTTWRWLQNLKNGGEVTLQTSNLYTIVSIVNYDTYNTPPAGDVQPDVQLVSSPCPTDVQLVSTKKKEEKEEKDKKDKKGGGVLLPDELDFPEFRAAWTEWLAYRRERKLTLTPRTLRGQLKKLADWGSADALGSLDRSITNGWAGLFPQKEDHNANNPRSPLGQSGRVHQREWGPNGLAEEETDGDDGSGNAG